jgi:adenine/guanine phosphoribosyltransferase-like PRPP-binding protein
MTYNYITTGEYYSHGRNSIAHAVKNGNPKSIARAASEMAKFVTPDVILIPMPGHTGVATYTKDLATQIANLTGAQVFDIMRGRTRETFYNIKKNGGHVEKDYLGLYLTEELPEGNIVIVDNCISTGTTAAAALDLTQRGFVLAYAIVGKAKHIDGLTPIEA